MAHCKSYDKRDTVVQKQVNDCCFTIVKATKVLTLVGQKLIEKPGDDASTKNIANIAKGLVQQLKKISLLLDTPTTPENFVMNPETVSEFYKLYNSASKELNDAVGLFTRISGYHIGITKMAQKMIAEVEFFKETLEKPNPGRLLQAASSIATSLSHLCYYVHSLMPENMDVVIHDHLMTCMQTSIHYSVQLQMISCMKSLYYPIISVDISLLGALRLLFATVSILLNTAALFDSEKMSNSNQITTTDISPEALVRAITTILHHGRPLPEIEIVTKDVVTDTGPMTTSPPVTPILPNAPIVKTSTVETPLGGTINNEGVASLPSTVATHHGGTTVNALTHKPEPSDGDQPIASGSLTTEVEESNQLNELHQDDLVDDLMAAVSDFKLDIGMEVTLPPNNKEPEKKPEQPSPVIPRDKKPEPVAEKKPIDPPIPEKLDPPALVALPFPPGPPPATWKPGGTETEYKAYMITRYKTEQWENAKVLHQRKLNEGNIEAANNVIKRIQAELDN
eukprot:TRINITY_DN6356_c0_g1_i1.p1 TRINITY_DN6356_c0_g1~~TRINITY_DN6356_c0_g1_i1.p1  ORF type:complete len:590 (-),score=102.38 TRINITY_DN6356_c0_g1_i1:15-1541(-)